MQGMTYDLGDAAKWEFFFPNVDKPLLVIPGEDLPVKEEDSNNTKVKVRRMPHYNILWLK